MRTIKRQTEFRLPARVHRHSVLILIRKHVYAQRVSTMAEYQHLKSIYGTLPVARSKL